MATTRREDLSFSDQVVRVRHQFGVSTCARLLEVAPGTIHGWARLGRASERHRQQIEDLLLIGELFAERRRPEVARNWLLGMSPTLGYDTPAEEIARGRWALAIATARDYVRGM